MLQPLMSDLHSGGESAVESYGLDTRTFDFFLTLVLIKWRATAYHFKHMDNITKEIIPLVHLNTHLHHKFIAQPSFKMLKMY